ncbi:YheC/YheD family protein [Paenibacillus allorhizosphaerae]|uniref:Endospore coat-associated protein YheD n=1 Tax=Paenibacillus allorhizosphaerae TaxID=2849866 RepID=A0ABM8VL16_9BACL|nr:YheC/YheD family protein [Paenibacillus allorhizosphaerae]CAG7647784.1 Endospore coat-associated protein YheD [Paenibacillus allorhizosphaerae]
MIGILYPPSLLKRLMSGQSSFEKPAFYIAAARKEGEEIIFFSLFDIHWSKNTVLGWTGTARVERPLPAVIINRTRTNLLYVKRAILRLKQMGKVIFNQHNVVSKLRIHRILSENELLLPHLPMTDDVTYDSVKQLLDQNACLFLKPRTSSVGNGIIRVRKENEDMIAEINMLGRTKRKKVGIHQLVNIVKAKKQNYLVQQGIAMMKYKDSPVDFRVSVQKNGSGVWQYTGMVGKVARKGAIVTNIHCGGDSLKASELFEHWGWNAAGVEQKIARMALRIASTLDEELPHIADLGLDIAIDEAQHPWLIEVNFRDLRITFQIAGEREKWRATFATPVKYAAYLNRQIKARERMNRRAQNAAVAAKGTAGESGAVPADRPGAEPALP